MQCVKIVVGVVRGLEYLYEKVQLFIIYWDIKFSNVLFFDLYVVKIVDFNLLNQVFDMVVCLYFICVFGIFGYYVLE